MTWTNYDDALSQMRSAGLIVDSLTVGKLCRCRVEGEREKKGWYSLHEFRTDDGDVVIVGSYGIWSGTQSNAQKIDLTKRTLTHDQHAAIKARAREDRKRAADQRAREARRAAAKASRAWSLCAPDGHCDYLLRKGVSAHGARFTARGNLVIPMLDGAGQVHGLQVIYGDPTTKDRKGRDKDYWPAGLQKQGHWYQIGTPTWIVIIAEGFATAATLHQASGLPVCVAFDANNLRPVAEALRRRYRSIRILIAADDDYLTDGNPGVSAASAAALSVSGAVAIPVFRDDRAGKKITDYNDLFHIEGLHVVRAQIEARLTELQWWPAAPPPPVSRGGEAGRLKSLISIDEACERYVLIYGGASTIFDEHEHLLVPKADVVDILPDHGWRLWKERGSARRIARLDEVGFDPTRRDGKIRCNLWGGWPTTPRQGSCENLLDLLSYLCGNERNHGDVYQWVLKWLAYPIQNPGAKMRTALVLHGPQGAGKNLFFESVMSIYGEYGRVIDQSAIEDKFNDWASRKLFLIADEVVARQELFHHKNKIKSLITGEWIRINPKNVTAHDERNHVNLVFLSNEVQPLHLEEWDRRFMVVWTPGELSREFYHEVGEEIKNGGIAALHDYLLCLDLGDFDEHTKPLITQAKRDLIDVGLESTDRFMREWRSGEAGLKFLPCLPMDLYSAYRRWCVANGESRPRTARDFLGRIKKMPGWISEPRTLYSSTHYGGDRKNQRIIIPPPDELANAPANQAPLAADWYRAPPPNKPAGEWLTDCYLEFRRFSHEE